MTRKPKNLLSGRAYRRAIVPKAARPLGWAIIGVVVLAVCAVGDYTNVYQTVESLLGGQGEDWLILLMTAFGTAVVVVCPPLYARYAKDRHEGVPARPLGFLLFLGLVWIGVVIGVTYVRIVNEVGTETAAPTGGGVQGTAADLSVAGGGQALTVFMTCLLVATGAIGLLVGWMTHDPSLGIYQHASKEYGDNTTLLTQLDGQVPQFEQAAADAHKEPEQEDRRYQAALAKIDAIEGGYRQRVAEAIARSLNDPGATTALLPRDVEAADGDRGHGDRGHGDAVRYSTPDEGDGRGAGAPVSA